VQRDLAPLLLLARTDLQHAVAKIDVWAVERERFSGTDPGDGKQPDQRLMTDRAQRRCQLSRGCHQRRDLLVGVDVWGDPRAMPGQEVLGGDLACRVDRCEMAREPAHDGKPLAPTVRVRLHRQPRPLQRQLGGDPFGAGPLEELDEPLQQPAVLGHGEPEPAADPQVVGKRFAKRGHAAPPGDGHGRASALSAVRSTFA
jgi:hypothetical protein